MAYVKVRESRNFQSTLVSQLNGNPNLPKDRLIRYKAITLYMKPSLLTVVINLGCDCGVYFLNTHETIIAKKKTIDQKNELQLKIWFVRRVYKMC